MKIMVLYNTTNGAVIEMRQNQFSRTVLSSGMGLLTDRHLTGLALGGYAQGDVDWVQFTKGGVTMRRSIKSWVDDTHAVLQSGAKNLEGSVSYELMADGAAVQFTAQEKADAIDEVKSQEGHDNVDAVLITTDQRIVPNEWYVDTADSNKLKPLLQQTITPE
jgi:hypothetical protein